MDKKDVMLQVLARQRDDALNALANVVADLEMVKAELAELKKPPAQPEAKQAE